MGFDIGPLNLRSGLDNPRQVRPIFGIGLDNPCPGLARPIDRPTQIVAGYEWGPPHSGSYCGWTMYGCVVLNIESKTSTSG